MSARHDFEVNAAQAQAVQKIANFVVRFSLVVPAVLTLESMRPLAFVGSQFMHLLSPAMTALLNFHEWDEVARLLEQRQGIEYIIRQIEKTDEERKT